MADRLLWKESCPKCQSHPVVLHEREGHDPEASCLMCGNLWSPTPAMVVRSDAPACQSKATRKVNMSDPEKQQAKSTPEEWPQLAEQVPAFAKTMQIRLRQHHVDGLATIATRQDSDPSAIIQGILDRTFVELGLPTS